MGIFGRKKKKQEPKIEVESVRVPHGPLGRTNSKKIDKTIEKMLKKGFELEKQEVVGKGLGGYTAMTFIKRG